MKKFLNQLKFDGKRLFLRNPQYLFFVLAMPIGFYILFTKVMTMGSASEMVTFARSYMGSMIVYSIVIGALFSLAALMQHDRQVGLVQTLKLTPNGTKYYYASLLTLMGLLNALSALAIMLVAVIVNHVALSVGTGLGVMIIAVLGSIPLMTLGVLYSRIQSVELLNVLSNLTSFPLAIISGLWWPLSLLPNWVQAIGKVTPTYLTNHLLTRFLAGNALPTRDMMGIAGWAVGMLILLFALTAWQNKTKVVIHRGSTQETPSVQ
jgi:ABC-2 type transport system permease protein